MAFDAETVPVNTSFLIINKDAFLLRCKLGKTIISIRTVYHYAPPIKHLYSIPEFRNNMRNRISDV